MPAAEVPKFEKQADHIEAEARVTDPGIDTRAFTLSTGQKIDLRPLPGRWEQRFGRAISELYKVKIIRGSASANPLDDWLELDSVYDSLVESSFILGEWYRLGWTKEWIGDNLDSGDMWQLVDRQMEVSTSNSFLRRGVLPHWKALCAIYESLSGFRLDESKLREVISTAVSSGVAPSSSRASSQNGESV